MIDMSLFIDRSEMKFNVEIDADEVDMEEVTFAIAGIMDSFDIIKKIGIDGAVAVLGEAMTIAEQMYKHSDLIKREKYEKYTN